MASGGQPPAQHHLVPTVELRTHTDAAVCSCLQDWLDALGANKLLDVHQCLGALSYSDLARRWEMAHARLRTGHTRLTHGFLMKRAPTPYSDDCLVDFDSAAFSCGVFQAWGPSLYMFLHKL